MYKLEQYKSATRKGQQNIALTPNNIKKYDKTFVYLIATCHFKSDIMLISRIQKDLFDFIESDPEDSVGLIQFWYIANSVALSAALTEEKGLKIILNSSSISNFQELSKKLFLVADKIILRDTNSQYKENGGLVPIPDEGYKPGYIDKTIELLQKLKPSPLTLNYNPPRIWTSTGKKLNNGLDIHYTMQLTSYISEDFAKWISTTGKEFLKTGKIIYAPFIPPIEQELEFLKHNISVSSTFGATPCFHQNYDWMTDSMLSTLVSLKFPFIENIDLVTLDKVKEDNYEEFQNFSKSILDSIYKMKSVYGTEEFLRENKIHSKE